GSTLTGSRVSVSCRQTFSREDLMFKKVDYIMVVVSDMAKSVAFYRDTLGLPLKFESPGWSEFQTGDTTFALHGGGQPKSPEQHQKMEPAGTCSLGFNVEDIDKAFADLKAKGVTFVMTPTERPQEGIKLA